MLDDPQRAHLARGLLSLRAFRAKTFPAGLSDEFGWSMLLAIFAAMVAGEHLTREQLFERVGVNPATGTRWLMFLMSENAIQADPERIAMTSATADAMRAFLDRAAEELTAYGGRS